MYQIGDTIQIRGRYFVVVGVSGNRLIVQDDEGERMTVFR